MAKLSLIVLLMVTISPLIWAPATQVTGARLEGVPDEVLIPYKLKSELPNGPTDVKMCRPNCTYKGCLGDPNWDNHCCAQIRCAVPGKPFDQCYFNIIGCNCTNCS